MLNKYLDNLVNQERVTNKLEDHLIAMAKSAAAEAELEAFMENTSAEDLAKLAGVSLATDACPQCAAEMQKLGSTYQCACGMVKSAKGVELSQGGGMPTQVMLRTPLAPQTIGEAKGERTGRRVGSMVGVPLGGLGGAAGGVAGTGLGMKLLGNAVERDALVRTLRSIDIPADDIFSYLEGNKGFLSDKVLDTIDSAKKNIQYDNLQKLLKSRGLRGAALVGGGALGLLGGAALGGLLGRTSGGEIGQSIGGMGKTSMDKTAAPLPRVVEAYGRSNTVEDMIYDLASQGYEKLAFDLEGLVNVPGGVGHMAQDLLDAGLTKEAVGALLGSIGRGARGMFNAARGKGTQTLGEATRQAGQGVREGAKSLADTYRAGTRGYSPALGGNVMVKREGARTGVLGGLGAVAKENPYLAGGVAGLGAAGLGYGAYKMASDAQQILAVGDAAGRIMAKTAAGGKEVDPGKKYLSKEGHFKSAFELVPEEIGEAIEEAKAREDIPGRSKKWGIGGAALGGAGGTLLGGLAGRGLGSLAKMPNVGMALGAVGGGAGGGMLGHRVGAEEGAEEAAADRLVSMLRGRRAYMGGAQSGLAAGLQRGYALGRMGGSENPQ